MKLRNQLDDFMSIACFKAAISGLEDILGKQGTTAALIAAGRERGKQVALDTGFKGKNPPVESMTQTLNNVFGLNGTKLCMISEIQPTAEGGYLIKLLETVCMAGEKPNSDRRCSYTMGAILGFMESGTGKSMNIAHVKTILENSPTDDLLLTPLS